MIGFHGCDLKVRDELVNRPDIVNISEKDHDWLGHGFYIWENNYERALQWASDKKNRKNSSPGFVPSVVGVIYQLEYCLDLTDTHFIELLSLNYELFKVEFQNTGRPLPINKNLVTDLHYDFVFRELDCAVIQFMHHRIEAEINDGILKTGHSKLKKFDTVRGIFTEGGPAFEGAGIQAKNHIQICIRNLNSIKGFFIPRKSVRF